MKTHKILCHMQNGWPLNHQRTGLLIQGTPGTLEVSDAQLEELRADCRVIFDDGKAPATPEPLPTPTPEDKPEDKPKRRGRK
jgi:hypothetical protein